MGQPEPLSVDDALDRLVNQFSDSMAFFRELIQNALDAGSEEVEIDFAYEDGKLVIHVDDWGAGMNREIIDTRLTRLFSSSKDGDRTKIGKFGIGFVSVFAIEGTETLICVSKEARALLCPASEVNYLEGAGKGVYVLKVTGDDRVIGCGITAKEHEGITAITNNDATHNVNPRRYRVTSRGGRGFQVIKRGTFTGIVPAEITLPDLGK